MLSVSLFQEFVVRERMLFVLCVFQFTVSLTRLTMKDLSILLLEQRLGTWERFEEENDSFVNSSKIKRKVSSDLFKNVKSLKLEKVLQRNLYELSQCGWYWKHFKDSQMCSKLLSVQAAGTFLLRDSSDPRHLFTLSVQTTRGPTSVRLVHRNGTFSLDAKDQRISLPNSHSVIALVQNYVNQFHNTENQVWVDTQSGRTHSPVSLRKPLSYSVPSLMHLSRVAVNKHQINFLNNVPKVIQDFIQLYPHTL